MISDWMSFFLLHMWIVLFKVVTRNNGNQPSVKAKPFQILSIVVDSLVFVKVVNVYVFCTDEKFLLN